MNLDSVILILHTYLKYNSNDMLKELDYVDPSLATKIHTLQ